MRRKTTALSLLFLLLGTALFALAQPAVTPEENIPRPEVTVVTIDGSINPGSADYIIASLEQAKLNRSSALIIELDTPGGLVDSTRDIVQAMLNSSVPTVVYVTPPGAHAGSAGVMITLASNIAAMAPSTNIGAASPVSGTGEMEETMKRKVTNDVAAWVKGIAEERGRNAEWAEKAVREAVSATATEAKELNVIDVIATDLDDLLTKIDGMKVKTVGGTEVVIKAKDAKIHRPEMSLKHKMLMRLADPNLAYIFMIIGFLGLYAEFSNPGLIFPGIVGAISMILFLLATQVLPINTIGVILIIAGIIMFVLEVKVSSFGMLTLGGLLALTIGSLLLFDVPEEIMDYPEFNLQVSWALIIPSVIVVGGFLMLATWLIFRTHQRRPETGSEDMVGVLGKAITDIAPDAPGRVALRGETWRAQSKQHIANGDPVVVIGSSKSDLTLFVEKPKSSSQNKTEA